MLLTNETATFEQILTKELRHAVGVDIAVGYCGLSAITSFSLALIDVAKRGRVRLVLGMYRVDGSISHNLRRSLSELHQNLTSVPGRDKDGTGVFVTLVDYHGKAYVFDRESGAPHVWLGSNNFSREGLRARLEACTEVLDSQDIASLRSFIDRICASDRAVTIDNIVPVDGEKKMRLAELPLVRIPKVRVIGQMELPLRASEQPRSGLNLCFGAGRKDKNGVYHPRPWYEVELSTSKTERTDSVYPKPKTLPTGKNSARVEFVAYLTNDGQHARKTTLSTYSDGNKALGSDPRTVLGEFLKGTLERAGVLRKGELITDDVLDAYGRQTVTLEKLEDGSFIVRF